MRTNEARERVPAAAQHGGGAPPRAGRARIGRTLAGAARVVAASRGR